MDEKEVQRLKNNFVGIQGVYLFGSSRLKRDFLKIVFDLEKETGMVEREELWDKCIEEGIPPDFIGKTVENLIREGTLYSPRDGYLKKT